jgi:hypothetical protein
MERSTTRKHDYLRLWSMSMRHAIVFLRDERAAIAIEYGSSPALRWARWRFWPASVRSSRLHSCC